MSTIYTPAFNKLRDLLEEELLLFINEPWYHYREYQELHDFVFEKVKEQIETVPDWDLLIFKYHLGRPYSEQVDKLLSDMQRRMKVKLSSEGYYKLTSYGQRLTRDLLAKQKVNLEDQIIKRLAIEELK